MYSHRAGFSVVEVMVVVLIVGVLAIAVVRLIDPAEVGRTSRDSRRLSDLTTLNLNIAASKQGNIGNALTLYLSVPDPAATTTAGSNCAGLGLPALAGGWVYHCAASSTFRRVNGTGWIPINFSATPGSPIGSLPVDPRNQTSTGQYYSYAVSAGKWELTAIFESKKITPQETTDGGPNNAMYELGTDLTISTFVH